MKQFFKYFLSITLSSTSCFLQVNTQCCARELADKPIVSRENIDRVLERTSPEIDLPGEVPLVDVLKILEAEMSKTSGTAIQFLPDHAELDLEGITIRDASVRDVIIAEESHTFRQVLDYVFRLTDAAPLTIVVEDGHILVTTTSAAAEMLTTRVYDISMVIGAILEERPVRSQPFPPRSGSMAGQTAFEIANLIMANISYPDVHWMELDGEGGAIFVAGNRLSVSQTYDAHLRISRLLPQLIGPIKILPAAEALPPSSGTLAKELSQPEVIQQAFAVSGWVAAFFMALAVAVHRKSANRN